MSVKRARIALPEPTRTARDNRTASCVITVPLITALRGTAEFSSIGHAFLMGEGREEIQRQHAEEADTTLLEERAAVSKPDAQRLGRIHQTGAWLSVLPSNVNGKELWAQEWRDSLLLRYGIEPPDFPPHCYRCGLAFSICHSLD